MSSVHLYKCTYVEDSSGVGPEGRHGSTRVPGHVFLAWRIAQGGVLWTFSGRSALDRSKWCSPSGQAAWTVHHVQNHTLLGHSPLASQACRRVGQPSSLRPHWVGQHSKRINWGRILGRYWVLRNLLNATGIHNHLFLRILPPPPPEQKVVWNSFFFKCRHCIQTLKFENSQDYAQKPQRNWTFIYSASGVQKPAITVTSLH